MILHSNKDSNIETVKLLLENGADPNIQDDKGKTALMKSCRYANTDSNIETVKLLLNVDNINVNIITNDNKYNALMLLCIYNPNQHETVKLLKSKTDLSYVNSKNKKIEDICLDEYLYLFSKNLDEFLQNHETIKSECFLCTEENIDCVKCEFDHHTCINCLPRVKYNCEACRKSF